MLITIIFQDKHMNWCGMHSCVATFGTGKGVLMERILWYLLRNQFVVSQTIGSHRAWRVNLGTGMGLIHSGELADIIFYNKVESIMLTQKSCASYGIMHDSRFRDDILCGQ